MKFTVILSALVASIASKAVTFAPLQVPTDENTYHKGEYIVQLREPLSAQFASDEFGGYPEYVENHLSKLFTSSSLQGGFSANNILRRYNLGYAAKLDDDTLAAVRAMPEVELIEVNQIMKVADVMVPETDSQQDPENWGLKRISKRDLPLKNVYNYPKSAGEGVDVYVIDNGVLLEHEDFEGRAVEGAIFPPEEGDGNHGTHVASTIAGKLYGVAKKANIINIKVLSSAGSGTMADVLAGIEFTAKAHVEKSKKNPKTKSVANMSLGGGRSTILNKAVDKAIEKGILFAVAAGNESDDACRHSPAGSDLALTVGATNIRDARAYFSNYGKCVDIFAPGVDITAAWNGNNKDTKTISGTSMATPHVVGVMALILADNDITPQELKNRVLELSSPDLVKNPGMGSANKLLFNGVGESPIYVV